MIINTQTVYTVTARAAPACWWGKQTDLSEVWVRTVTFRLWVGNHHFHTR